MGNVSRTVPDGPHAARLSPLLVGQGRSHRETRCSDASPLERRSVYLIGFDSDMNLAAGMKTFWESLAALIAALTLPLLLLKDTGLSVP